MLDVLTLWYGRKSATELLTNVKDRELRTTNLPGMAHDGDDNDDVVFKISIRFYFSDRKKKIYMKCSARL